MNQVRFADFECLQFEHAGIQCIVTTEVGPRVLFFGRPNGFNHFFVKAEHMGLRDGLYHSFGGHRLWLAPEDRLRTYTPDSSPVKVEATASSITLASGPDCFGVSKSIRFVFDAQNAIRVDHWFTNFGIQEIQHAPWAVTVMAPGGFLTVPMHTIRPQSENLLPVSPLVLWGYTDLSDERYSIHREVIRLRQLPVESPTKFGICLEKGIASYSNAGQSFLKIWETDPQSTFTDMGCNFEAYTRHDMLEVESLGSIQQVQPGCKSNVHTEFWQLIEGECPSEPVVAREWLLSHYDLFQF